MTAGQKLSVTLADYGWKSADEVSTCRPYAYIIEKSVGRNQTICAGNERERHVYTSTSDEVLIQIVPYSTRHTQFVLWFDGKQKYAYKKGIDTFGCYRFQPKSYILH